MNFKSAQEQTESRLLLFRKSALTGRRRAPGAGLTRQVPAEAFELRKELDDKRILISLSIAFLHRTDDGKDEPGDSYNRVKRHEE